MTESSQASDSSDAFATALAHHHAGRVDVARSAYETLLATYPKHSDALNNLGVLLNAAGESAKALQCFDSLAALLPLEGRSHANRGVALRALGRHDEAAQAYETAIRLQPDFPTAHNNLGNLLHSLGQFDKALVHFEQACKLQPQTADSRFMLSKCLIELQLFERAQAELSVVLKQKPDDADAWGTLARLWSERHCMPEALACFERGLQVRPDYAGLIYNRGLARLLAGDVVGGFADYERRFDVPDFPSKRLVTPQPLWNGEALPNKTLLLHAEQGLGDTLQFLRYVELAATRANKVLLLIQAPLTSLVILPANVQLVHDGQRLPAFDVVCALLSLPHLLGTHLLNIPATIPYLQLDTKRSRSWEPRFAAHKGLRVGLVWAGNPSHKNDSNRSLAFSALAPLLALNGVQFYSFQVGERSKDLTTLAPELAAKVHNLAPDLHDFGDTAAALQHVDVLVCVDTSIAHVAGALGVPVWLLLPWMPDWRWMLNRDDTPWYPSMRILRQPQYRDWGSVINTLTQDLQALAAPTSDAGKRALVQANGLVEQGRVLLERNEPALAAPAFWRAIRECPTMARAASALAITAFRAGHTHAAVMLGARACRLNPADPESWSNCGAYFKAIGDLPQALHYQTSAVTTAPTSAQAQSNLGNTLGALGRWPEALQAANQAIALSPQSAEYHYNLGIALKETAHFTEALHAFRKAQQLGGGYIKAALHESLLELLTGDLSAGWQHYESRWDQPDAKEKRSFVQPLWTGQALTNTTILVHAEQGFGDSFQFLRYIPLLAQRGAKVILVVQSELESIASRIDGCSQLIPSGAQLPPFDYHCPLLSLPAGFGTTLDTIPSNTPYIKPLPDKLSYWSERLGKRQKYRVALVWAGRPTHGNDANRSMRLQQFEALTRHSGIECISVQKGDALSQIDTLAPDCNMINLSTDIQSFEDTAAILHLVNELVSVDTSVAHLAGAVGTKVRLLLPLIPDWRWLLNRADSPWYPTFTIYRQQEKGNWSESIQKLIADVSKNG